MNYNREITLSCAGNRKAASWPAARMLWSEFVDKLRTPIRSAESYAAYMRMPKSTQDELKDVGGFVGGELRGGRRKTINVAGRDLVTLDLDAIPAGAANEVRAKLAAQGFASCVYSTRKHAPERPRLRIVIPLDRTVSAEEYEPIARRLGERLGLAMCDPTTFQAVRMMYWPSVCADGEYIFDLTDAPFVSAGALLESYRDWRNMALWPQVPGAPTATKALAEKQADPTQKSGLVGAWCREYDIYRVMDEIIPGAYEPTAEQGRYTYTGGSTTGGAIIYGEGKWLYSHHGTDPAGGKLVNAWDLARLHLYADRDERAQTGTPANKLPSFLAMAERAKNDPGVQKAMARDRLQAAAEDFGAPISADDTDWAKQLQTTAQGGYAKTIENLLIILRNDPNLRGKVAYDDFKQVMTATGKLPWNTLEEQRPWSDEDDAGLRWYVEKVWQITGEGKLTDALGLIARENAYDELRKYLLTLPKWDGVPRVDRLLVRYLLADDTPYVRAVTRKTLVAAVARAMNAGIKFDTVLTLLGSQGSGKSMLVDILGGAWYSDSIQTFEGKDAAEQLRGVWLMEIPEVDRFANKEASIVKQFITRRDDIYREAYGRRTKSHPRRCVFIATANPDTFLTDESGNRRWWVVRCQATSENRGADMAQLRHDRDQIWAEALGLWQLGESLVLDKELSQEAKQLQEDARIADPWEGEILEFVARKVPSDWDSRTPAQRLVFWADEFGQQRAAQRFDRGAICAAEIWAELLHGDIKHMDQRQARRINGVLRKLDGWNPAHIRTAYGTQRGFVRKTWHL